MSQRARVVLGVAELKRMTAGKIITVKIRPDTEAIDLSFSLLAQGEIAKAKKGTDFGADFADAIRAMSGR